MYHTCRSTLNRCSARAGEKAAELRPGPHHSGSHRPGSVGGGGGGGPGSQQASGSGSSWGTRENLAEMAVAPDENRRAGFGPGSCKNY